MSVTPYCAIDDVRRFMPKNAVIGASSEPTETEVTQFCSDITLDLNICLQSAGYALPVTDVDQLAWLKDLCAKGVAARVLKIMFPQAEGPGSQGIGKDYQKQYDQARDDILKMRVLVTTAGPGLNVPTGSRNEDAEGNEVAPSIVKGMTF